MPGARIGTGFSRPEKYRHLFFNTQKVQTHKEPTRANALEP